MRDLTRHNAHRPAHVMLKELGIRYFTPMTWRITQRGGQRIREHVPFIQDLVFVYILAVGSSEEPRYYSPEEITPSMYRRRVKMVGGRLDGCEGYLLSTRGSRVRRLLVELPELLAASVEVEADYIQLL